MSDLLAAGYVVIGGGGLTYTYTDFELTAEAGYITIDAPDLESGLSSQTMFAAVGYVTIGGGSANLSFKDWSAELATGYVTIGAGTTQLREVARVLFPTLSPSSRNFTPPEYAVSKYKTMNGAKSYRLWASQPGGGVLDLEFVNLNDDDAERICAAHDLAKGSANDLILPDEVLFGVEGDLLQYMKRAVPSRTTPAVSWPGYAYGTVLSNVIPGIPDSLPDEVFWYNPSNLFYKGQEISSPQAWSFDGPSEVQSVKEGISAVRVRLSARRKLSFEAVGSVGLGAAFAVPAAVVDEIDPGLFNDCDGIGRPPESDIPPLAGYTIKIERWERNYLFQDGVLFADPRVIASPPGVERDELYTNVGAVIPLDYIDTGFYPELDPLDALSYRPQNLKYSLGSPTRTIGYYGQFYAIYDINGNLLTNRDPGASLSDRVAGILLGRAGDGIGTTMYVVDGNFASGTILSNGYEGGYNQYNVNFVKIIAVNESNPVDPFNPQFSYPWPPRSLLSQNLT